MTTKAYPETADLNQGAPNLAHLQYLQANWGPTEIAASFRIAKVAITAAANVTAVAAVIPVGAEIIDVWAVSTANTGAATATLRVGTAGAAITNAIAIATLDALSRATTIDTTYSTVGTAGVEVICNGANDRGNVFIAYKK